MPQQQPKKRDAEKTKEKLVLCAERLFVKKGYHAVGVDEVAAAAHVNKRMIYVYFGDKRKLYEAVIDRIFSKIDKLDLSKYETIDDYREQLSAVLKIYFSFLDDNLNFVRLLSWEKLYADKESIQYLASQVNGVLKYLFEILKQGVEKGAIRPDIDIQYLASNINSLFIGFFSNKVLSEAVWGHEFTDQKNNDRIVENMLRMVFDGVLTGVQSF